MDYGRREIAAFSLTKMNSHNIGIKNRKIKDCSQHYFKLKGNYVKNYIEGRAKTLSSRDERSSLQTCICRKVLNQEMYSGDILNVCEN